ncbi:serine/threonine-protein kinase [Kitasatospora sp. NPDC098652]|uniref:serine/threonine-protein kinase n=1 Tax=Kitasatospora sp. NPDC098652 TaxID=3364095 RepID=UPI0038067394
MTLSEHDPREIGGYLLEGRLGAGGMGVVYRARSVSGRQVAVKVIRPELAADAEFRARFRQEVTAARKVSGAFTAPVLDADPEAPAPWLATLFVPGPSLGERVSGQGPLAPTEVRRLAAGLAEALQEIHRVGLIHRDLKPGNVLLAEDGPRVIDFGIARSAGETQLTSTGVAVGTPPFMAPEQFRNGTATTATDVFALGSVLAFAATGRGPFGADSSHAVGFRVVYEEPDLAGLAPELYPLIIGCLAKEPEQRPTVEGLLRMTGEGARGRTVQLRTGPVVPAAAPASVAAPVVPTPTAPNPVAPAQVPTPAQVPPPMAPTVPPYLPTAPSAATAAAPAGRPRPRKALLVGAAVAAVVVAAAGTLGYLTWHDQQPGTGQAGQTGQTGPSAPASGVSCAPAGQAAIGVDGMEAALVERWTADFGKACPGNRLTYKGPAAPGADDPFKTSNATLFADGGLDAAGFDTTLTEQQAVTYGKRCATGQVSQLPVTVAPLAVVFNVPGVADLVLDAPTLAKIFRKQIQAWNDPAIRALNPAAVLPGSPIDVRVPAGLSWSSYVFSQYLGKAAPADWPYEVSAVWGSEVKAQPGATEASIPGAVAGAQWSIGFVPLHAVGNLHTVRVRTGDSDAAPSTATANAMAATGTVETSGSRLSVKLDYQKPVKGGYPVVGIGYLGFCERGGNSAVVAGLASYAVSGPGQASGESMKYGTLPPAVVQQVQGALAGLRAR